MTSQRPGEVSEARPEIGTLESIGIDRRGVGEQNLRRSCLMVRFYAVLLLVEFIAAAMAPVIFINIENRLIAGMIAGAIFVALGIFILLVGMRFHSFRKTATYWAGCLHLFGSALPLLVTRLFNYSKGFEDILVLGLPGPVFHRVSTLIFLGLMIATTFDLIRVWRARAH